MTSSVMTVGPGGAIYPEGNLQPPMAALWWPLHSGTGVTTGSTTPSGFANVLGETVASRVEPLTLTNFSGTFSYASLGGATFPTSGKNMLYLEPAGDNLTFCDGLFNLGAYLEDETLLIGFEIDAPAGWNAAVTGTFIVVSFGDHNSTGGSWRLGLGSGRVGVLQYKAVGTAENYTAPIVTGVTTLPLEEGGRNAIVFELRCVGANTFVIKGYSGQTADNVEEGPESSEIDLSDPSNSGTAAPGLGTIPRLTIGGRYDTASTGNLASSVSKNETVRNFWAVKSLINLSSTAGLRACRDMLSYRGKFPRSIRIYQNIDEEIAEISDGSWVGAIGDITDGDTFIALCPEVEFADHPKFTIVSPAIRTGTSPSNPSKVAGDWMSSISSKIVTEQVPPRLPNVLPDGRDTTTYTHWRTDATPPGLQHVEDITQGTKFGRSLTGPDGLGPAFHFAAHNSDTKDYAANRHRCEAAYRGADVVINQNVDYWIALRVWYDFSIAAAPQHATMMQLFHGITNFYPNSDGSKGLNPNLGVTLYQTVLRVSIWGSNADPVIKVPSVAYETTVPSTGGWFDLVIKTKLSNLVADNPYTHVWLDGVQFVTSNNINMYRPNDNQPQAIEMRCGIYPGQYLMSPDVKRVMWIKRMLIAKNVGNYSQAQIRAALTATLP